MRNKCLGQTQINVSTPEIEINLPINVLITLTADIALKSEDNLTTSDYDPATPGLSSRRSPFQIMRFQSAPKPGFS